MPSLAESYYWLMNSAPEFKAGDTVGIVGKRGSFRIQRIRGDEVLLYGGTAMRQQFRSVTIDQIKPLKVKPDPRAR